MLTQVVQDKPHRKDLHLIIKMIKTCLATKILIIIRDRRNNTLKNINIYKRIVIHSLRFFMKAKSKSKFNKSKNLLSILKDHLFIGFIYRFVTV